MAPTPPTSPPTPPPTTPPTPGPTDRPVHRYRASASWSGSTGAGYEGYDRNHVTVTDPPTVALAVSADPAFLGDGSRLDPEQLLLAAAVSCQLLSFLAVAARARLDVVAYEDDAEALMPGDDRPVRITRIILRPRITLAVDGAGGLDAGLRGPNAESEAGARLDAKVRRLVEVAHRECYIANSLRSDIVIEPVIAVIDGTPDRR